VRLLVKNLGRGMPVGVVREVVSLNIRFKGVTDLRSEDPDQDIDKCRPPAPHFIVSVAPGPEVLTVPLLSDFCGLCRLSRTLL
jgi:hypothetical protein